MARRRWLSALLTVAALSHPASLRAQDPPPPAERMMLERQFQERLGQVVKRELRLDDAQMRRLQQSNQRFERRRRELLFEERGVRGSMRDALAVPDSTNQERVATLLDRMLRIQRDRVTLLEDEQRELATFMTPVQRARYFGIQDQLRRRMDEIRRQRQLGDSARPGRGGRVPPSGARRGPPPG